MRAVSYTILINDEVKAIFLEDFKIFNQYSFTYSREVEILWTESENDFLLQNECGLLFRYASKSRLTL